MHDDRPSVPLHIPSQHTGAHDFSRRGLVRGAAWGLPIIAAASVSPAFATSGNQLRLSLRSQEWDDRYLVAALQVENLSTTTAATSVVVTLVFKNSWRSLSLIEFGPDNGSYGLDWARTSFTQTSVPPYTSTATLTLPTLPARGTSVLSFRASRPSAYTPPYGESVSTAVAGASFTVASDSLTSFITGAKPGPITLNGSCGVLSLIGPGFTLKAGANPVPAGSVITVTSEGLLSADVLPLIWDGNNAQAPGLATVQLIGDRSYKVTLAQTLAAGSTMHVRYLLSVNLVSRQTGVLSPPTGQSFPTGTKTTGSFNSTLVLCYST